MTSATAMTSTAMTSATATETTTYAAVHLLTAADDDAFNGEGFR
jgi:hypothetical protein